MSETKPAHTCLACQKSSDETPLIMLEYRGSIHWICREHFPLLIHNPAQLVGRLADAESLKSTEHCH